MKFTIIATALIASLPVALAVCRGGYTYKCDHGCTMHEYCNPDLPCAAGQSGKTTWIEGPYQKAGKCNWIEDITYECCTK